MRKRTLTVNSRVAEHWLASLPIGLSIKSNCKAAATKNFFQPSGKRSYSASCPTSFVIGGEKITLVYKFSVKPISQLLSPCRDLTHLYRYIYFIYSLIDLRSRKSIGRASIYFFLFLPLVQHQ